MYHVGGRLSRRLFGLGANREVGPIRFVTSRLLEAGLKPDKGRSAPFALNKTGPVCDINITEV